jgi:glycogen synthase
MNLVLPQRILMTSDTVGGVWNYAMELCSALEPYGIEVVLATMGARLSPGQVEEASGLANVSVFQSAYKLEWMREPWSDVSAAGDLLLDLAATFAPDMVHLNNYAHASLSWQAPTMVVAHSCVLSWWRAVKKCAAPPEWDDYKLRVQEGLMAADLVVAPSHAMQKALEFNYGPMEHTVVIPNGRSLSRRGSRSKEKIILAAGRLWDEGKNISALKSIAPALPWPVYLAGDGEEPGSKENSRAGQNGPGEVAHSLGRLPSTELGDWMARAALYVSPARYEPFGLSILEAAMARCALVLGDIPSLRENWQDAAVFVPAENPDQLRETLEELIADEPRRQEFGRRAYERASNFTSDRMVRNYLDAYSDLLRARTLHSRTQETICAS